MKTPGPGLMDSLFVPGETEVGFEVDVFVMRCVVPHVQNPKKFLNQIFAEYPDALLFIEFQDFSTTIETGAFWQISHDHLNYFHHYWFSNNYQIIDSGSLSKEWGWVLIANQIQEHTSLSHSPVNLFSSDLESMKRSLLEQFAAMQPVVILGAGGRVRTLVSN